MDQFQEMLERYFDSRLQATAGDADAYRAALEEKANALRMGNMPASGRLQGLEAQLAQKEKNREKLSRAMDAGQLAYATAYDIINDLVRLNFSMLPGTRMSRMSHEYALINGIRMQDVRLQKELQGFRERLADLQIQFEQTAEVGPLIRSERPTMDMLFAEDEILGKAMYAAERLQAFCDALRPLLLQLEQMYRSACEECAQLAAQRISLIEQARIFSSED